MNFLYSKCRCSLFLPLIGFILLLSSCEKDIKLTEWKDTPVVYALLNLKDSVQYIRINRAFVANDPYQVVQNPDSISYGIDELKVTIQKLDGDSTVGDVIEFTPTFRFHKEEGIFTSKDYFVYRSVIQLKGNTEYYLEVENLKRGWIAHAKTKMLGNQTISYTFLQNRYYTRPMFVPEKIDYPRSLNPSDYPKRTIRFLYKEMKGEKVFEKYVDWIPDYSKDLWFIKDDDTNDIQFGDDFYKYLASQITVDPNVKRQAIGVDLMLYIANEDLFVFINLINRPDAYQSVPDYTNIENGVGIFSSRYYYTFFAKKLKEVTIDSLSWGRFLYYHKFCDSHGNWH